MQHPSPTCTRALSVSDRGDHQIIEWPRLDATLKIIQFQLHCHGQGFQIGQHIQYLVVNITYLPF